MYDAADRASNRSQKLHFIFFAAEFLLLILVSLANVLSKGSEYNKVIVVVSLSLFALVAVVRRVQQWERKWYQSRALAESIKTTAWRYAVKATPFDVSKSQQIARQQFRDYLSGTLKANRHLGAIIRAIDVNHEQITSEMDALRMFSVNDRKEVYSQGRVDNQQDWYSRKSREKGKYKNISFLIIFLITIILLTSIFFDFSTINFLIDLFDPSLTLLTGIIGWIEVKRYGELEASYSLTSHEIALIKSAIDIVQDEDSLSDFVNEAERAFSREHTQWLARSEIVL